MRKNPKKFFHFSIEIKLLTLCYDMYILAKLISVPIFLGKKGRYCGCWHWQDRDG